MFPETFSNWLNAVEEPDPSETVTDPSEIPDNLTDWLTQMQGDGLEEQVATPEILADDSLDWLQDATDEPETAAEALPDWFGDLDQAGVEPTTDVEDFTDDLFGDDASGIDLDWMGTETGDLFAEETATETANLADSISKMSWQPGKKQTQPLPTLPIGCLNWIRCQQMILQVTPETTGTSHRDTDHVASPDEAPSQFEEIFEDQEKIDLL